MQPQQYSRIDLADLKAQIVKRIGAERSKRYFIYLNKLLSQKLSKKEFDKFCYRVFGSENISLHNQLIRSILKNACQAKTPPPIHLSAVPKLGVQAANSSPSREDGHEQSGTVFQNQNQNVPIWSNGVLPVSPRKGRSAIRDRKLKDRPSPLGPNGKVDSVLHASMGSEDSGSKVVMENGDVTPCDYQRPVQHLQPVAELPESERAVQRSIEKIRMHNKDQAGVDVVEDGEEIEQLNRLSFSRSPLVAPLGIPLCPASVGGPRKAASLSSSGDVVGYYDSGGLSDTETLRKRMEQIAAAQGLGSVSMECANMLNNMLDVYLKRLIRSCVELVGARSTYEQKRQPVQKQQIQGKVINGMWPSNHMHMSSGNGPMEPMQEQRPRCSISMLDFKVAMELNPQQLGEDWPLLLEKICMHAFEE
ncbi:uncharacterized protein LOC107420804 [Ziziphus jujuba]|uniref:Uncharacterized protein LOC107420804 n=2 Tax=Ziziphus jujuba TaxID=326968 RepID=A0A6P3ZUZ5_ZIZJJ|nr:uncharacterized protein LOC107420804 [Ziziphus jujuba]KAH7524269.1 hypothetical protein FEM48_Zijuj06G0101500 [Ziziphus jujuba var. spinosa]